MRRFGLDYEALRAIKPDLIYCAISGYGQSGPSAGLPAYAPVIHAASGYDLAHMAYQPGRERPDNCGIYIADTVSGRDLGWYFDQVYRSSNVFDYGVHALKSERDGDSERDR